MPGAISDKYNCHYNGVFYADKQTWKPSQCISCTCNNHIVKCEEEKCPELPCEVKRIEKDTCCPVCTGECVSLYHGMYYNNSDSWKEDNDCTHCTCKDGHKYCYSESCTPLECTKSIKTAGSCCHHCENEGIKEAAHKNIKLKNFFLKIF